MKLRALTIQQPFAHQIFLPSESLFRKRVENRVWSTKHRGRLLVHAGKSMDRVSPHAKRIYPDMIFGAVIGVVEVVDCLPWRVVENLGDGEEHGWVKMHHHATGPWCWILKWPFKLPRPVPCRGMQRLFYPSEDVIRQVLEQMPGKDGGK